MQQRVRQRASCGSCLRPRLPAACGSPSRLLRGRRCACCNAAGTPRCCRMGPRAAHSSRTLIATGSPVSLSRPRFTTAKPGVGKRAAAVSRTRPARGAARGADRTLGANVLCSGAMEQRLRRRSAAPLPCRGPPTSDADRVPDLVALQKVLDRGCEGQWACGVTPRGRPLGQASELLARAWRPDHSTPTTHSCCKPPPHASGVGQPLLAPRWAQRWALLPPRSPCCLPRPAAPVHAERGA